MPKAKPKRSAAKAKVAAEPKTKGPTLNGIPLTRKPVWVPDVASAQFRAARKRDAQALKAADAAGDNMQFIEAVLADRDVQKWWK